MPDTPRDWGFRSSPHRAGLPRADRGCAGAISAHRPATAEVGEPDATGLVAMDKLGLLTALHPRLRFDRGAIERSLTLLPDDGRPDLLTIPR